MTGSSATNSLLCWWRLLCSASVLPARVIAPPIGCTPAARLDVAGTTVIINDLNPAKTSISVRWCEIGVPASAHEVHGRTPGCVAFEPRSAHRDDLPAGRATAELANGKSNPSPTEPNLSARIGKCAGRPAR